MLSSSSSTIPLLVFVFISLCSTEALVKLPDNEKVPAVIVFGDSIVDPGNNNNLVTVAKCNFPPYGRDFIGGIPTGRFSNGKIPSDFIAEELGIKKLLPAYLDPTLQPSDLLTGVSFASGASGYDPLTPKIPRQYDFASYADLLVIWASSFFKELYGLGARRIGVFSAPPLGCLPSQRTLAGGIQRECVEKYNEASQLFNTKLSSGLDSLNTNFPLAKFVYVDIYNPLLDIIQNPQKSGFEVVNKGCCGTGLIEVSVLCDQLNPFTCNDATKYVFWDSYHPTERAYKTIIGEIFQGYVDSFF
ncbi:GDSL esterase/lipase EXL3 [Vitis vinifera]|uniref:GDSL esterase/lipase EXL3 n=1 Tax=Vitis vinifera TaxID=29760 RepID=A0A438J354_VITVI|nr:GDSL esterase/lipase EXL3 [Vitis vinifera]